MSRELYFLRSSEQKIVMDMVKYAYPQDEKNLEIYYDFFGSTAKDLGVYALVDKKIAGAIWIRRLNKEHNSSAFVDENTPVLSLAVLREFREKQVGSYMMEQFLQEAGALYERISVDSFADESLMKFYEKFGFTIYENSIMVKELQIKEPLRPSDGYDPSKWMD